MIDDVTKETFNKIYEKLNKIDKLKREIMDLVSQLEQEKR